MNRYITIIEEYDIFGENKFIAIYEFDFVGELTLSDIPNFGNGTILHCYKIASHDYVTKKIDY